MPPIGHDAFDDRDVNTELAREIGAGNRAIAWGSDAVRRNGPPWADFVRTKSINRA